MTSKPDLRRGLWASYVLGFAFSGFFDGILLHQVLQWHHLLLGIQAGPLRDPAVQLMADGLFHLLMYALAAVGVWLLWRSHRAGVPVPARGLAAALLIGFGAWHVLDGVVSHWVLGLHRIRMDSANPLFWDLLWLGAFGLAPLAAGLRLRGGDGGRPTGRLAQGSAVAVILAAGLVAALPPDGRGTVAVLAPPNHANRILDGVQALGGGIVWSNPRGTLWLFSLREGARARDLYGHGAWLVTRSPAALGCLAWSSRG